MEIYLRQNTSFIRLKKYAFYCKVLLYERGILGEGGGGNP